MDLHPVILAGGRGSRMYPITERIPKALLPVRNQPMIYYPIKMLEANGFKEITIIARNTDVKGISAVLETLQGTIGEDGEEGAVKFAVCEVADGEDVGSADALRTLKGRVKMDLLVVPCDIVSCVPIHQLWDTHVSTHSALTMLLVQPLESQSDESSKKILTHSTSEQDLIGLTSSGQVVYHSALVDVEDELTLSRKMLKRFPHFTMHCKLLDTHLYIIQHWLLDYLSEQKSISSIKGELIPHLVRRQGVLGQQTKTLQDLQSSSHNEIEQLALSYSSCPLNSSLPKHSLNCHALVVDNVTCMRVNTIPLYMEANRMSPQMLLQLQMQFPDATTNNRPKGVSGDSLIGSGVQLSDKCSIKRSVIGHHCSIGDKTKIINSVIMDYVVIGENCTIQGCVISGHVRIEDKVNLKDCTVGRGFTIEKEAEHKGDILVESAVEL